MKIVEKAPPNFSDIARVFDLRGQKVVFTYGKVIYNPGKFPVSQELMVHETVHSVQQGRKPKEWWDKYLIDPAFRLGQEVEAYRAQYRALFDYPRQYRRKRTRDIIKDLASSIYGNLVDREQAEELITANNGDNHG